MRRLSIAACLLLVAAAVVTGARLECICPENGCLQDEADLG